MELGLPGAAYIYQGEELGLFEVADIPWITWRIRPPSTPPATRWTRAATAAACRCRGPPPMSRPWPISAVRLRPMTVPAKLMCRCAQPASSVQARPSASPPAVRADGVTPAADPHLPQPLWFKDYAVDVEQADPDSMFALYHAALAIRQESLTATRDTTAEQVDMGADVVAYRRAAVEGRTFTSVTNFGTALVSLPEGSVVLTSGPLTPDGQLPTDTSAWVIK